VAKFKMKFDGGEPVSADPRYVEADLALEYRSASFQSRAGPPPQTSALGFETLQLDCLLPDQRLCGLWGYAPARAWRIASLGQPPADREVGGLRVLSEGRMSAGIAYAVEGTWFKYFDRQTHWFCLRSEGEFSDEVPRTYMEFATRTVAEICQEVLVAVWLHLSPAPLA
jgi:hypothetical protein